MKAAVLHAVGEAPRYEDFEEPVPNEDEALVRMRAASLKNIERMMADGSHYDDGSHHEAGGGLSAVVGIDGVGVLEDGTRVYCGGCRPPYGTMAEMTAAPRAFCLAVPDRVDDLTAAALPNPALSSWLALVWRARLRPDIRLPAAVLRSSGLEILGSGGGNISYEAFFETFLKVWELASKGEVRVDAKPVPLSEVEGTWQRRGASGRRLVFVP